MKRSDKSGQIWIETVLYTLIAFVMIGLVLAYAKPKIEEIQDKSVIEQSVAVLQDINEIMLSIKRVSGNQRVIELGVKKGTITIDGVNDIIKFKMESRYTYTEPGEDVNVGGVIAHTTKIGKFNEVVLTSNHSSNYNITYKEKDEAKIINKASTPYRLVISNKGKTGDKTTIDFEV